MPEDGGIRAMAIDEMRAYDLSRVFRRFHVTFVHPISNQKVLELKNSMHSKRTNVFENLNMRTAVENILQSKIEHRNRNFKHMMTQKKKREKRKERKHVHPRVNDIFYYSCD
jgi:hypothetical protein